MRPLLQFGLCAPRPLQKDDRDGRDEEEVVMGQLIYRIGSSQAVCGLIEWTAM